MELRHKENLYWFHSSSESRFSWQSDETESCLPSHTAYRCSTVSELVFKMDIIFPSADNPVEN